jgi:maleylacetate reductase
VEALYAKDANPIISMIAEEGVLALAKSLPVVVHQPANLEARAGALYGAWLGGVSLGAVGMALHHKLSHAGREFQLAPRGNTYGGVAARDSLYRF